MDQTTIQRTTPFHAHKMAALGQLASGVAHDFNNLLSVIAGSLSSIERHATDEGLRKYVDSGTMAVERAATLVRQILAFAGNHESEVKPIHVPDVLAKVETLIRRSIGAQIDLPIDNDPNTWAVLANPNRLELAMLNLAVNARDAMPQGGCLSIGVRNLSRDETRQRDLPPGDHIIISVVDTGVGMPPDILRQAAEPYFTTKGPSQGTGLGLSLAKTFAVQSKGKLTIHSQPAAGTTISIYLPRAPTA